jgi:hypothetical protein
MLVGQARAFRNLAHNGGRLFRRKRGAGLPSDQVHRPFTPSFRMRGPPLYTYRWWARGSARPIVYSASSSSSSSAGNCESLICYVLIAIELLSLFVLVSFSLGRPCFPSYGANAQHFFVNLIVSNTP